MFNEEEVKKEEKSKKKTLYKALGCILLIGVIVFFILFHHPNINTEQSDLNGEIKKGILKYDGTITFLNWGVNTSINNSLPVLKSYPTPIVFNISSNWYMLCGANDNGYLNGYYYNNSDLIWYKNTTINASLPAIAQSRASVFYKDSSLYMLVGEGTSTGRMLGYVWNGAGWDKNLTINASLPTTNQASPSVFYFTPWSSWMMITGNNLGTFAGYRYNNSDLTWYPNSTIAPTQDVGGYSYPSVFYKDSSWYLISGQATNGGFFGYVYNGTTWLVNTTINASLPAQSSSWSYNTPYVFFKDSNWYLVSGINVGGIFGYVYNQTYTSSGGASATNPTITLNAPSNYYNNTLNNSITFNATAKDSNLAGTIANVTFYLDGVVNVTNTTSCLNCTYTSVQYLSGGHHNWSVLAYNNNSLSTQSSTYEFWIILAPTTTLFSPIDYFNSTTAIVNFTSNETAGTYNLSNATLYIWNSTGSTINAESIVGNMWTANDNSLTASKVFPNGTYTTYSGFPSPLVNGINFDGTYMWVTSYGAGIPSVTKIYPNGTIFASYTGLSQYPNGIAWDGNSAMWTTDRESNGVSKIFTNNGTILNYNGTGVQPNDLALDSNGNMWTANAGNIPRTITKVFPNGTMTNLSVGGENGFTGIAFDGVRMWATSFEGDMITKIWLNGTYDDYPVGDGAYESAWDGNAMWTANYYDGGVSKVFMNGTVLNYTGLGQGTNGIAFDGINMWVASFDSHSVAKVFPNGTMTKYVIDGNCEMISYDGGVLNPLFTPFNSLVHTSISGTYNLTNWSYTFSTLGNYTWNVLTCDTNGGCSFATSNYTLSMDTTPSPTAPTITLNSPVDYFNTTIPIFDFNVTITDDLMVQNVTLNIDGTDYPPITTHVNGTYIIPQALYYVDGTHYWSILAYDNDSNSTLSATRYWTTNTTPSLVLDIPVNNANLTYYNVSFNSTLTSPFYILSSPYLPFDLKLYINGSLSGTSYYGTTNLSNISFILSDGYYSWYEVGSLYASSTIPNTSVIRYFTIDTTRPTINVTNPITETTTWTNYTSTTGNNTLFFNWTTYDLHPDVCWNTYNWEVPEVITCNTNKTFFLPFGNYSLFAHANDTFGNENVILTNTYFDYRVFENSRTFPATATEGSIQTFILNLTAHTPVTSAYLNYNGTRYSAGINAGAFTILTSNIAIPSITTNGQATILWEINTGQGYFNSTSNVTNITNMLIDNCSVNQIILYNFTMKDEVYQSFLNDTDLQNNSAKLNLQIYPFPKTTSLIESYSAYYNLTNPFQVCINSTFGATDKFSIDAQIEYQSLNHADEFYHIQNDTLNNDYLYNNISLLDLDSTHAQEFSITYKDASYNPVADVLIVVKRKYVDEGIFKVVEIPMTNYNGMTTASLQTYNTLYSFYVYKNGKLLDSFLNTAVFCANQPIGDCSIILGSKIPPIVIEDYTKNGHLNYASTYNQTTRTIVVSFNTDDDTSPTMVLNGTLIDNLGTTSACYDTATSSSGTLTCVIPKTLGNGSAMITLFKDNVEVASRSVNLERTPDEIYGHSRIFLLLILYLMLIGMAISGNPMIAGIFLIIGAILGVVMNFVSGSGTNLGLLGGTILWFIIAVILVLTKGARRQ
jgi:hypothetical protein